MALIFAMCSSKTGSGIFWAQDSRNMIIKIENDNRQYVRYSFFMTDPLDIIRSFQFNFLNRTSPYNKADGHPGNRKTGCGLYRPLITQSRLSVSKARAEVNSQSSPMRSCAKANHIFKHKKRQRSHNVYRCPKTFSESASLYRLTSAISAQ